ncbi:hypothetical protein HB771_03685 (plasmid) [Rhizobium leguminosarum bv. viciae]|nr:hypothetical protein HB771_03685 [Rhizobium leguminosarum bv. viciae]
MEFSLVLNWGLNDYITLIHVSKRRPERLRHFMAVALVATRSAFEVHFARKILAQHFRVPFEPARRKNHSLACFEQNARGASFNLDTVHNARIAYCEFDSAALQFNQASRVYTALQQADNEPVTLRNRIREPTANNGWRKLQGTSYWLAVELRCNRFVESQPLRNCRPPNLLSERP